MKKSHKYTKKQRERLRIKQLHADNEKALRTYYQYENK
jgi:hypothetical protein